VQPEPIADRTQRIVFRGFSVLPPQGSAWVIAPPFPARPGNLTIDVGFGRKPDRPPERGPLLHTVVATVQTIDAGTRGFADAAALGEFVKTNLVAGLGEEPLTRFRVLSVETAQASLAKAALCVAYKARVDDTAVPYAPGRRFLLNIQGRRCRHPSWPRYLIDVNASERYPDGETPFSLDAELAPYLDSLAFTGERPLFVTNIPVGLGPQQLVAAAGSIWVAYGDHGVARIDPLTNQVTAQITVGKDPIGIAFAGGSIWSANRQDGTLSRIDPATNQVIATIRLGGKPFTLATGAGALWMSDEEPGSLVRLDPSSGRVLARIPVGDSPANVVVSDDAAWVPLYTGTSLVRVDLRTNAIVATIEVPRAPGVIGEGAGAIWVAGQGEGVVARVDPVANKVVATIPVFARPSAFASDGDAMWVSGYNESTIFRIDPRSNERVGRKVSVGAGPTLMIHAEGALWVGCALSDVVSRIDY
jgi:YVTN family beta-propeller protein